jgi:hypothetical protein
VEEKRSFAVVRTQKAFLPLFRIPVKKCGVKFIAGRGNATSCSRVVPKSGAVQRLFISNEPTSAPPPIALLKLQINSELAVDKRHYHTSFYYN